VRHQIQHDDDAHQLEAGDHRGVEAEHLAGEHHLGDAGGRRGEHHGRYRIAGGAAPHLGEQSIRSGANSTTRHEAHRLSGTDHGARHGARRHRRDVLTGKVLGLDSTMIAGFQLMRIIIVLILVPHRAHPVQAACRLDLWEAARHRVTTILFPCARRPADLGRAGQKARKRRLIRRVLMAQNKLKIGWIGMGRMGYPMAERLLKAGYDVSVWNRTAPRPSR